jgi:hypothetical protein
MKQTPTKRRKISIEIEFEETKDVKFLLENLSKIALEKTIFETKHLSAYLTLSSINRLPFQEPRLETINGVNCMVFKSIM